MRRKDRMLEPGSTIRLQEMTGSWQLVRGNVVDPALSICLYDARVVDQGGRESMDAMIARRRGRPRGLVSSIPGHAPAIYDACSSERARMLRS